MKSNHHFAFIISLTYVFVFAVVSLVGPAAVAHDGDEAHDDPHHKHEQHERHSHKHNPYKGWTISAGVTGVEFDHDGPTDFDQDGGGVEISAEYRVSRRVGLKPSLILAGSDRDRRHRRSIFNTDFSNLDHYYDDHYNDGEGMGAMLFTVNFHLTPDSLFDFHLGPTMGIVVENDFTYRNNGYWDENGEYHYDDHYDDHDDDHEARAVLGLELGVDVRFGAKRNWVLSCNVKGVGALDDDDNDRYDFVDFPDAWDFATIAVGYSF